jgi:Spy/CpxP family protein refolding chaperone
VTKEVNMSVRILLASLLALSLAAQEPGPAGPRGPMPGPGMAGRAKAAENMAFMAKHLNLSDQQKTQMKEIHQKHREGIQTRQKAAMEAREALRKSAQDPAASTDTLRKLHQAAADRQFDLMLERRSVKLETRALMTPEQRAEADRLRSFAEERRQFRMEHMRKTLQRRPEGRGPGGRGPGGGGPGMGAEALEDIPG